MLIYQRVKYIKIHPKEWESIHFGDVMGRYFRWGFSLEDVRHILPHPYPTRSSTSSHMCNQFSLIGMAVVFAISDFKYPLVNIQITMERSTIFNG